MSDPTLRRAAEEADIQPGYHAPDGSWRAASAEALTAVLGARAEGRLPPAPPWPEDLPLHGWRRTAVRRDWGFFLPHHALRNADTRGCGDYTALAELGRWAGSQGASVIGTLPLLPTFLARTGPYEPSPYAPVSRRHWSEALIDPTATAEWRRCPAAHQRLTGARQDGTLDGLRSGDHLDPQGTWALQWSLLSSLAAVAWADPARAAQLSADPEVLRYARFRAACEARGPWPTWAGTDRWTRPELGLTGKDVHDDAVRTWAYAQHEARRQIRALRQTLEVARVELYLDLPIGTHPDGYDTFVGTGDGPLHASGVSTGAPPDPYFPSGQDWGFPPEDPLLSVQSGLPGLTDALAHHAAVAHRLRIDHVLGFHRLFWVPSGLGARHGVYVSNPAEAHWRTLVAASHAHRCEMIGEDLGVLPPALAAALQRHQISGLYVAQFQLQPGADRPLAPPRPGDVASLNTHDTPTFAGWWEADDLHDHRALGWLTTDQAASELAHRRALVHTLTPLSDRGPLATLDLPTATRAMGELAVELGRSDAGTVLLTLEDCWGERRPHNVPGTWRERPNWRRRSALDLGEIQSHPGVLAIAAAMRRTRPR